MKKTAKTKAKAKKRNPQDAERITLQGVKRSRGGFWRNNRICLEVNGSISVADLNEFLKKCTNTKQSRK